MLFGRPRFTVVEDWGDSGDVTVYFDEAVSPDLRDRVGRELSYMIPDMPEYQRNIYHVEGLVNNIFARMTLKGNLRLSHNRKQWVWAEEV